MRKLILGIAAASSLALGSAASAAVTVTSSTNLTDPNPMSASSVVSVDGTTTIEFGQNPVGPGTFNSSFVFNNTVAGLYSILIGSSTPGLLFTDVTVRNATTNAVIATLAPPAGRVLTLDNLLLAANTNYSLNMTGTSTLAGALNGNITIMAVPEPATWALMLLGFGGIGMALRRRQKFIPQLA